MDKAKSERSERRASRRRQPRGSIKMECRKGMTGLGRNLLVYVLDISETGAQIVADANLPRGQDAEILIRGGGHAQGIKRAAEVVWSLPTEKNCYCVGLRF